MDTRTAQAVMLTMEMIDRLQAAVMAVATGSGWGRVSIVIEKGEPVRVQTTTEDWLNRRR